MSGVETRRKINDILKELFRKSIHLCAAFIPLLLKYLYLPTLILLSIVLILYIISENLRRHGKNIPLISAVTKAAARKRDENKFVMGPVCLAAGILLTAAFFEPISASIGIYALALGDGLASLVGKVFGRNVLYKMHGKTAEGSLACFTAIFISSFIVTRNAASALIIASAGMFIELLPLKDYDNVLIPLSLAALHQFLLPLLIG
ncbi:MAG: phosphatidate cytidylyltransferase [Treponemataceae bacterium]|nr:phosphatidate cytidylyltransferase [Treponemataceae bacterium]